MSIVTFSTATDFLSTSSLGKVDDRKRALPTILAPKVRRRVMHEP
jgi:hypothetical protein